MEQSIITPRKRQNLLNGKWALLKPQLPADWRERLIVLASEYDSLKGADLLRRVHSGRCQDENVLNLWEKIISDYETEKNNAEKRKASALKRAKIKIPT